MDSKRKLLDYHTDEEAKRIVYLYFYLAVERGSWFLYGLQQHGHTGGLASDDFLRCIFPKYYDPDEEEYFFEVSKWAEKYVEDTPEDAEEVAELLEKLKEKFGL